MIQIADLGRGLPDEFYEGLYQLHDSAPNGSVVGSLVKDYNRFAAYRLCRFSAASTKGVGQLWDTSRKKFQATTADGGSSGQQELTLTVESTDTVAKDDFARGILLVTSGPGAGQRFYIYSNEAKDASHKVKVMLDRPIKFSFAASNTVMMIGHKYMNCVVGTAGASIAVGASQVETITSGKYGWLQSWGIGPGISSTAVDGSDSGGTDLQDGTPFIQAADGELALMPDIVESGSSTINPKPVVAHLIKEGQDLTDSGIMPVEWTIPTEM